MEADNTHCSVPEWIIASNPSKYDVISAFRELGTIDWTQSANFSIGDIVYIYISSPEQALRLKCRVKQVDKPESTIEDRQFAYEEKYISKENGRYAELEMIEELKGVFYTKKYLEPHGFIVPQGSRRVTEELKEYLNIISVLKNSEEMDPDKHDGSYELMRSVIDAYETTTDRSVVDYNDLNLVYAMAIGTWRQGIEAKKKMLWKSNLSDNQKVIVEEKLDEVWKKAGDHYYKNRENYSQSIGMFGTGFYSFKGKTDNDSPRNFIELCIKINHMDDGEEQIYEICEGIINESLKGLQSAAVSTMLHCLKPTVFPVLNTNSDFGTIYEYLKLDIKKVRSIETYIDNCRAISRFRNENFAVKNYRIFDNAARMLKGYKEQTDIDYIGVLEYLNNNQEIPYEEPIKDSLSEERKGAVLQIKERGQWVIKELGKIGQLCCEKTDLDKADPGSWLDGSKTKTKKYLELQLKKKELANDPISVSLFVEKNGDAICFRVSLEIKNDGIEKAKIEAYHKHLELEQTEGLVYATGSNQWGRPDIIQEPLDRIREKYQAGNYRKVQPSIYIEFNDEKSNDQYEEEILAAVEKIMPYYDYVLGVGDEYWPSLDEFNPNITKEMWIKLLHDPSVTKIEYLDMLQKVLEQGGESTCSHLEEVYGGAQGAYNAYGRSFGQAVSQKLNIPAIIEDGTRRYYVFPFVGRHVMEDNKSRYSWKLRIELQQALEELCVHDIAAEDEKVNDQEFDKNLILYGPPGTGKTYSSAKYAVAICDGLSLEYVSSWDYDKVLERYNELKQKNCIVFTTFHQSYGYEEFIEGIKPVLSDAEDKSDIGYRIEDGIFKAFCKKASKSSIPHVFVIDEINRGNISKIFGELITLIESTKRDGAEEAMEVVLPYSGELFSVPNNVYIIGTMNTADRSIALMDTALRRRFGFVEMMPEVALLDGVNIEDNGVSVNIGTMLRVINERIAFLYDREHTIGHAFFMKLLKGGTVADLAAIFERSVVPLLQEYFYEDYEKIRLVLGDGAKKEISTQFIQVEDIPVDLFGIDISESIDISEQKNYMIAYENFKNIMTYKGISKKL